MCSETVAIGDKVACTQLVLVSWNETKYEPQACLIVL